MKTNYFVCGAIQNNKIYWQNRDDGEFCCFDLKNNIFKYLYTIGKMKFSADGGDGGGVCDGDIGAHLRGRYG